MPIESGVELLQSKNHSRTCQGKGFSDLGLFFLIAFAMIILDSRNWTLKTQYDKGSQGLRFQ